VLGTKVKELTINPGQTLTMQRHFDRSEHWHVAEGHCQVELEDESVPLHQHEHYHILPETWHRLHNPFAKPCKIVEIQYGIDCTEQDIERR
jgi:mannose-6-phosphate isomerase-like protein (cupin superfamily)